MQQYQNANPNEYADDPNSQYSLYFYPNSLEFEGRIRIQET